MASSRGERHGFLDSSRPWMAWYHERLELTPAEPAVSSISEWKRLGESRVAFQAPIPPTAVLASYDANRRSGRDSLKVSTEPENVFQKWIAISRKNLLPLDSGRLNAEVSQNLRWVILLPFRSARSSWLSDFRDPG